MYVFNFNLCKKLINSDGFHLETKISFICFLVWCLASRQIPLGHHIRVVIIKKLNTKISKHLILGASHISTTLTLGS